MAEGDHNFPDFAVAVGEEGSDPLVWHGGKVVRVDQFAMSGHDEHFDREPDSTLSPAASER